MKVKLSSVFKSDICKILQFTVQDCEPLVLERISWTFCSLVYTECTIFVLQLSDTSAMN